MSTSKELNFSEDFIITFLRGAIKELGARNDFLFQGSLCC